MAKRLTSLGTFCDVTVFPENGLLKKAFCRQHNQVVYELGDTPSPVDIERETNVLQLHIELHHGLRMEKIR